MSWLIGGVRVGQHERHALVVGLDDEPPVGHDPVLRDAAERPLERRRGSMPPASRRG